MAMLAEKRTKTKYFLHHKVLNAKGFSCLQGSDSFGHRMLERMGWSQGKGLGTNMDGIKEPIKLTYKCDNKGIGCDKSRDGEEAVAQQKEFDALLATLSQEATDKVDDSSDPSIKNTPTSLELRSQKSRARVHYHKFTRGKDLSRATSKDLASILGAPAPKPTPPPAPVVPAVGPVLTYDHIETTGTNIRDYFKHKFESKKRKIENAELSPVPKKCKVSNSETFTSAVDQDSEENMKQSNKVKSKKKDKRLNSEVDSHDLDESVTKGRRKSVTWGEVEVSFVSKYIKDMVDTSSESVTGDISTEKQDELESSKESSIICDERKKKKKDKKKNKSENTHVGVNDEALDGSSDGIVERSKDKKEKEKKPAEESAENNESVENKSLQNNFGKKQKKQRRGKEEHVTEGMNEGTNFIIGSEDHNIALGMDKKKKKRKKKKSKHCEEIISTEECVEKKRKEYPLADPSDSKQGDGDLVIDSVWKDQQKNPEEGKRKKRKKNKESITVMSEGNLTENAMANENSNLECVPEELPKLNPAPCESSNTPVLSVLTQARIEKWKKRKKNNLKKIEVQQSEDHLLKPDDFNKNNVVEMGVENNSEVKMKKNTSMRLQYNPNQPTQDYNHRKLLVTLGVSRKLKSDKVISVVMPESNFKGSNLDSIPGYGRAIPSL